MPRQTTDRKYAIGGTEFAASGLEPGLYVVATPLGNLADITLRALDTLAGCDFVVCEDSRVTARLLQRYSIDANIRIYHDHNAARVRPGLVALMQEGRSCALVTDAGMPLVSDPGYKLVRDCLEAGIAVDVIPGPTAPVTALVLSGLPSDRFTFAGFLPPKREARRKALADLPRGLGSLILFEGASRIVDTLRDVAECLEDPQVAVGRELTKLHQEVLRGCASEVAGVLAARPAIKGEITLVIALPEAHGATDEATVKARLKALLADMPPARAASTLARETGLAKSDLYAMALALKGEGDGAQGDA